MKLRPNKFKHTKNFRSKWIKNYKLKKLKFGQYGIKVLNYIFLTARLLNRYKIMMHLCVRKGSLYNRSMWIRYNITIPLTKKPKGSRMGSGKGKMFAWGFKTFGGTIFFEFKNVKYGRAYIYYKGLQACLNCNTNFVFKKKNPISGLNFSFYNYYYSNANFWNNCVIFICELFYYTLVFVFNFTIYFV